MAADPTDLNQHPQSENWDSKLEKFLALFPDTGSHTIETPTGQRDPKGKVVYKYSAVHEPISREEVAAHIDGHRSIVRVPLFDDSTVRDGWLDSDEYRLDINEPTEAHC